MRLTREYNLKWIKKKRQQHKEYILRTQELVKDFSDMMDKETGRKTSSEEIKELAKRFI